MTKRNLRSKESTLGEDSEQLFQKKIRDLESVNETLKRDVEELRSKLADVSISSSVGSSREFSHKSIATKEEGMSSRSKSNSHSMCSTKKQKTESCVKQVDGQVQKLKAQNVKLQCKIKLDSMQFRLSKASLEKEILQLKKKLRNIEFEKHVLSALNRRQKLILQLKNTQALTAVKRLKLLLQSKKTSSKKYNGPPKGTSSTVQVPEPKGTSSTVQECSNEVGLLMKLNKIHSGYERQMKEMAEEVKKFSLEASVLKAEFEGEQNSFSASCDDGINQTPMDSEVKKLKEEFNKLSTLFSQMDMTKPQLSHIENTSEEAICVTNDESSTKPSQLKDSEETLCDTNDGPNLEQSQPKTCEEAHCKKEQSKAEMCCSCTKKSLCKTKNCKCRANGIGCGISCGCIASKCSNREENVRSDKALQAVDGKEPVGISNEANKQPLRDIGNIQEAGKVGKLRKVQKPVAKK